MQQQQISNIKALSILHLALFTGQVLFAGIAYYLGASKIFIPSLNIESSPMIVISMGGLAVVFIVLAFSLFSKKTESIRMNAGEISEKLTAYRSASIVRWAMLEAPNLLTIICFLLTGKQPLLLIILTLLAVFFYTKPVAAKVGADLGITEQDVN